MNSPQHQSSQLSNHDSKPAITIEKKLKMNLDLTEAKFPMNLDDIAKATI